MVYGELGRYPVELQIKIKTCFWNKIVGNPDKLSGQIYRLLFDLLISGNRDIPWVNYIKSIFDETGFSNIWDGHKYINPEFFKVTIKQRLQDQYIQKWFSDINNSSRGEYYSKFKTEFKLENYFLRLNAVHRNYICKLRTSHIKFPIGTGRWMGIPRDERLCNLCNLCIGNEFHYIFCCELLKDIRTKYLPNYFIICPCEAKMNTMLKIGNTQVLTHLSLFLQKIVKLL